MGRKEPALRVDASALVTPGGLLRVHGRQWVLDRLKKPAACHLCHGHIDAGLQAYRPLVEGAQVPRAARICRGCAAEQREKSLG